MKRNGLFNEENSVQVICFVLDAAGKKAGGFFCFLFPVNILIADNDIGITGYFTEEFRNGKAALRIGVHFIAIGLPFRIDVGFESRYSIIGYENSSGNGNLRRSQANTVCFIESLLHIIHKKFQTFIKFFNRLCLHF